MCYKYAVYLSSLFVVLYINLSVNMYYSHLKKTIKKEPDVEFLYKCTVRDLVVCVPRENGKIYRMLYFLWQKKKKKRVRKRRPGAAV